SGFLFALSSTLDVLFRCLVPLRDGFKQFETQLNIELTHSHRVSSSYTVLGNSLNVESARNEKEIAKVLLDWMREDSPHSDADAMFADLMIHQVALLNGVMAGVTSLLAELSPESIEGAAADPRRGRGGLQ